MIRKMLVALLATYLLACGPSGEETDTRAGPFAVSGVLAGLATGQAVTLQNNGGDDLLLEADGAFRFATELADGAGYAVTVGQQPTGQRCTVSSGSGTIDAADVVDVVVDCSGTTFSVGGDLAGLVGGETVTLQNNGGDDLELDADGAFRFATELADGAGYAVTVSQQPTGQTCTVSMGTGRIGSADVSDVEVDCVTAGPSGSLDTRFNPGGATPGIFTSAEIPLDNGANQGHDVAIDALGRIVVVGKARNAAINNEDAIIIRLDADGALDTTFDGKGYTLYHDAAGGDADDNIDVVGIDSQGRIVSVGDSWAGLGTGATDLAVWRTNPDGTLDTSFGTSGVFTMNGIADGNGIDDAWDMTIDGDDNILVAGSSDGTFGDAFVLRILETGGLDLGFDGDGVFAVDGAGGVSGNEYAYAVSLDASGRVVVAGRADGPSGDPMPVWRLDANGDPDASFGTDGLVLYQSGGGTGTAEGRAIAFDAMGRILIGGWNSPAPLAYATVWRFTADGDLDTSFAASGVEPGAARALTSASTGTNYVHDMAVDGAGNLVLVGWSNDAATGNDMFVARFLPDGDLDTSFNPTGDMPGTARYDDAAGGADLDQGIGIEIDSSGRYVIVGTSTQTSGSTDIVVWRVNP